MKRASYREAIDWIANNDSAGEDTAQDEDQAAAEQNASYYVSSVLIADIFGVECERIGRDVMRRRRKLAKCDRSSGIT